MKGRPRRTTCRVPGCDQPVIRYGHNGRYSTGRCRQHQDEYLQSKHKAQSRTAPAVVAPVVIAKRTLRPQPKPLRPGDIVHLLLVDFRDEVALHLTATVCERQPLPRTEREFQALRCQLAAQGVVTAVIERVKEKVAL